MGKLPELSVVIPTYNRPRSVRRTLESLRDQSLAPNKYEVIVVDDGSTLHDELVKRPDFPFHYRYLRIPNGGATQARNYGVGRSRGRVIVLVDDDVTLSHSTLEALQRGVQVGRKRLATGVLVDRAEPTASLFGRINGSVIGFEEPSQESILPFTLCNTQLLAVRRSDFLALGKLSDPTGGWPNWDDVDFGYRAHRAGFDLVRCPGARAVHWDYSLRDLETASKRWELAAQSAVRLFSNYPELQEHLPMFQDKLPVQWRSDSLSLILRKLMRRFAGSRPILSLMEGAVQVLENALARPNLLRPLYRWIIGGHIYQGYRRGIRDSRNA